MYKIRIVIHMISNVLHNIRNVIHKIKNTISNLVHKIQNVIHEICYSHIISNLLHKISIFAGSLAVQVTRPMRVLEIYIETHIHTDIVTKRLME